MAEQDYAHVMVPVEDIPTKDTLPGGYYDVTIEELEIRTTQNGKLAVMPSFVVCTETFEGAYARTGMFVLGTDDDLSATDPKTWGPTGSFGAIEFGRMIRAAGVTKRCSLPEACAQARRKRITIHINEAPDRSGGEYDGVMRNSVIRNGYLPYGSRVALQRCQAARQVQTATYHNQDHQCQDRESEQKNQSKRVSTVRMTRRQVTTFHFKEVQYGW